MKYRFGLSLSGGGYRAAAFHLGTLRYLHKAGVLGKLECLSVVSGGAIIGAAYCLKIKDFNGFDEFERFLKGRLQENIIKKILLSGLTIRVALFVTLTVLGTIVFVSIGPWIAFTYVIALIFLVAKFQFKIFPVSIFIEDIFDKMFYEKKTLSDLVENPCLIINSTNLQSGRLFYFTRDSISDSTYDNSYSGYRRQVFKAETFPIAKAVMCSSCFPSFFTPIEIGKEYFLDPKEAEKVKPILVDGGVYDNQGIHKLTHKEGQFECRTVVVSDAGNLLPFDGRYNNTYSLLLRTVEVFMNRIKMFQMMTNLYQNNCSDGKEIAYITLGWNIDALIPGFVRNLRNGNLNESVRNVHGLSDEFVSSQSDQEIADHIARSINFTDIKGRGPSEKQIIISRSVSTNLTALSEEQIDALSLYAETMTELQIKLYCPTLLN